MFADEAAEKGLDLRTVVSRVEVLGDPVALIRVMTNLVANAVRHTDTGKILIGARREGETMPPKLTPASLLSFATHWDWSFNFLLREKFRLANVATSVNAGNSTNLISVIDYINSQFDRSITWKDAEELIAAWGGPFAIKGVMSVEDAVRARDAGASAIMDSTN